MLMAEARAEALLRNIDDSVRDGLTGEQLAAIRAAAQTTNWSGQHPIDLRLSLPAAFGGLFVALVVGREQRHPVRRARDRALHSPYSTGNLLFCAGIIAVAGLAGVCLVALLGGVLKF